MRSRAHSIRLIMIHLYVLLLNEKLKRMVYRGRNHPSLVIFNLINEFGGRLSKDKELVAKHE